jgi:hypothetical protein
MHIVSGGKCPFDEVVFLSLFASPDTRHRDFPVEEFDGFGVLAFVVLNDEIEGRVEGVERQMSTVTVLARVTTQSVEAVSAARGQSQKLITEIDNVSFVVRSRHHLRV